MQYTYKCTGCERESVELRRVADRDNQLTCPACGSEMVRSQFEMTAKPVWVCNCPTASGGK